MSQHHSLIKNDPRWHAARAECLERDGWACVDCGDDTDLQADHLIELAELVANDDLDLAFDVDNLATRCGSCNRKRFAEKHKTTRLEWISPAYPEVVQAIAKARLLEAG